MSSRTLIRGGCVLALAHKSPNFTEADVLIDEDKIVEVGPGLRARDAEVIDATDTIVMPGFVDTHRHAWKSLIRNLGATGSNGQAPVSSAAYGEHHQPDDVYAATLIGLLGAVEAGITTVVDWSDIQINDLFTDAVVQAHTDSGLRTVLVHSVPSWAGDREEAGVGLRRFVNARAKASSQSHEVERVTIAAGTGDPQRDDLDRVIREWTLARELGLRIHTHAGMEKADSGVISDLAGKDLLGNDVTLVHCTYLNGADLDAVVSKGAVVSVAPSSEMGEGSGSLAIQELIDREIRPGLGIDDERVAPGDMFAQMRAAISIQHATLFDLKLAGKAGVPHLLSTRDVIRYATTDGARVAGLDAVTGSLEPGKQADIIMLRTDRPNIFPINDPIGAVVWGMDTSNIDWVFVAGRAVMRRGALTADVARIRNLAIKAQRRLAAASGLLIGTSTGVSE